MSDRTSATNIKSPNFAFLRKHDAIFVHVRPASSEQSSGNYEPEIGLAELTRLVESILAKAFRGELVPQDPRDEPASELLARIRDGREALGNLQAK